MSSSLPDQLNDQLGLKGSLGNLSDLKSSKRAGQKLKQQELKVCVTSTVHHHRDMCVCMYVYACLHKDIILITLRHSDKFHTETKG